MTEKKENLNIQSFLQKTYTSHLDFPSNFVTEEKEDCEIVKIYPIQKGFGNTIANSLRRVLLSNIRGVCVSSIKISSVSHMFSTHADIQEDIFDLCFNFRQIIIKMDTVDKKTINFSINKTGPIYASDIDFGDNIVILNPDLYLFTAVSKTQIAFEIELKAGFGFVPALNTSKSDLDRIYLDCLFSPIKSVSYEVEESLKSGSDIADKIKMQIKTDGTISAKEALKLSAAILREYYRVLIDFDEISLLGSSSNKDELTTLLSKEIVDLDLSVRSQNCLKNEGILYIGQLVQRSEADMLKTPNFGKKSLDEIKAILSAMGLSLGMKHDNWNVPE